MKKGKQTKGTSLRPTSNRVREALFDIIRSSIKGAVFLDLYAGTGAVGFDAINEDASKVLFVEANKKNISDINRIIEKKGIEGKTRVLTRKATAFIEWAEEEGLKFDIIFLDPPYHTDEITKAMAAIGRSNIINENGIVAAEHFTKIELPETFDNLHRTKEYHYGDTMLSFYSIS
jgi:16S rRNA (guanine966-N2)-methyltransferase